MHQNMSADCSWTSFTVACWLQLEKYANTAISWCLLLENRYFQSATVSQHDQFCFWVPQIHQNMSAECSRTSLTVTCWVQLEKYAKCSHFLVFVAISARKPLLLELHNGPRSPILFSNDSNTSEHVRWMFSNKLYSHMLNTIQEICKIQPFLGVCCYF